MKTREQWDKLYIDLAKRYGKESSCLRRAVGACITINNRAVCFGYNGAPSGIKSCKEKETCLRENSPSGTNLQQCVGLHSEMNAILQAAKLGISIEGGTLYCTHKPCSLCAKLIIGVGIKRVVYETDYPDPLGESLLKEAHVELIQLK